MSLEQARQYLARVLPWPQNGEEAYVNVWWTFVPEDGNVPVDKKGNKIYPWSGTAVKDIDAAVRTVRYALKRDGVRDIYACMSTQSQVEERIGKNGWKWLKAHKSQQNAVLLKSLFIDIDVGKDDKEKGYDTQNEAIEELQRFIREVGLKPPSLLVFSGGGVHTYWTLSRGLPINEWRPLAHALANAIKRHGLKCDVGCTVDGARVLRIPDTFNCKLEEPRPVALARDTGLDYSVETIEAILAPYKVALPSITLRVPDKLDLISPKFTVEGLDELAAGIETHEYPPIKALDAAKECPWIREAILTGGEAYDQPQWNLTTLIATFLEDGRNVAHKMGCKHPGYTRETTDALYDRKEKEKAALGLGWPSCQSIFTAGSTACKTCQHFTKGKTPLHHARPPAVAVGGVPPGAGGVPGPGMGNGATPPPAGVTLGVNWDIPKGYMRRPDGVICHKVTDKKDSSNSWWEPLADYPMTAPFILNTNPDQLVFYSQIDRIGDPREISLFIRDFGSQDMRKDLGALGLTYPHGQNATSNLSNFMNAWSQQIRVCTDPANTSSFGWNDRHDQQSGFVFAKRIWTEIGSNPAAPVEPALREIYEVTGTDHLWRKLSRITTAQRRPGLDVILASSFGAPLVKFTGVSGCVISVVGRGGIGKTTTAKVAQAVWGHPKAAMQGTKDTAKSVANTMGKLRNLPLYWDEIKEKTARDQLVNVIFDTTRGKEQNRLNRDITLRTAGMWQTLFMLCNNDALLEHVKAHTRNTSAGVMRLFEYELEKHLPDVIRQTGSDMDRDLTDLEQNHGHAGAIFAQFLGAHMVRIKKEVGDYLAELHHNHKKDEDERFWLASIAACCMGAKYANELKLTDIDEVAMREFLLRELSEMRKKVAAMGNDLSVEASVAGILTDFRRAAGKYHTLYTDIIYDKKGRPQVGAVKTLAITDDNLNGVWVQVAVEEKRIRIANSQLEKWLKNEGHTISAVVSAFKREYKADAHMATIGIGTRYKWGREYVIDIEEKNTPGLGITDEVI